MESVSYLYVRAENLLQRLTENNITHSQLSFNGTADKVRYGIIVFASKPKLELNIMDYPAPKPKAVIKKLGEIGKKVRKCCTNLGKLISFDFFMEHFPLVEELRKIIKEGTNIQEALSFLDFHQLANSYIDESRNLMKRHVFILTDGNNFFKKQAYLTLNPNDKQWLDEKPSVE